jgi:hypothetical protein
LPQEAHGSGPLSNVLERFSVRLWCLSLHETYGLG